MKTAKLFVASSIILLSVASASAQDFRTGYFLGGYQYAYRKNPAFASEHNFFSIGLGQFGANIQSDFGFSDFVKKNAEGQYVLALNKDISSADFLSGFNQDALNKFEFSSNVNLISRGHWNKEKVSFSTFDVSVKTANRLDLPYDLFRFLKDGASNGDTFDFSGTGLSSRNYLELAYGTSKIVKNVFSYGIRIKALVGLANASMTMDNLKVAVTGTNWNIVSKGTLSGSVPFAEFNNDSEGFIDFTKPVINAQKITKNIGLGGAIDAGLSINFLPWLTLSASILDFGYVNWANEIIGNSDYAQSVEMSADSADGDQLDNFVKTLPDLFKFKAVEPETPAKTLGSKWEQIPFRVNGGLEVRVPFYQRLSIGALYTMYGGKFAFNTNDILLSANWTPLNFLSASVSTRLGDNFKVFGAAINLHPSLFNLFVGVDAVSVPLNLVNIGALLPDSVPAAIKKNALMPADDLNLNAYVGLSFALGKRQIDYRKMSKSIILEQKEKAEAKAAEKKEKEEQKAKEQQLKEYEKAEKEAAKQAEKEAKEAEKQAKIQAAEEAKAAKQAEKEAKEAEKIAKAQAAEEAKAAKEAEKQAKADAKAAKEAAKAAKAQEKAAKAAAKAAATNAALEAKAAEFEAAKATIEQEPAAPEVQPEEAKPSEAETLLETILEPAPEAAPAEEAPKTEEPANEPAKEEAPAAPTVFEFPTL